MQDIENKNILINTQDRLTELFNLSLRVNQETPYCVFVKMSGHCDNIEFEFRQGKETGEWGEAIRSDVTFYYDRVWNDRYQELFVELSQFMHGLLERKQIIRYKAEFENCFTNVSKTFEDEADRAEWMEEVSRQFKQAPEWVLSEHAVRQ